MLHIRLLCVNKNVLLTYLTTCVDRSNCCRSKQLHQDQPSYMMTPTKIFPTHHDLWWTHSTTTPIPGFPAIPYSLRESSQNKTFCSTKLHTATTMTSSLECCTKTRIEKPCTEQPTNVLFFYSDFVWVAFDNFLLNEYHDDDNDVTCCLCMVVENSGLTGDDPSLSSEPSSTSSGGYTSVTVVLAVGLAIALSVLVIIVIVTVVRRLHVLRLKNAVDQAPSGGGPSHVSGSVSFWGFDSIRSRFSITSDDSVDDQLS